MRFADLQGNQELKRVLAEMVDSGRIPHAILFHEDDGGGAFPLSVAFLQYLYCTHRSGGDSCGECASCNKLSKLIHPDLHIVFPATASRPSYMLAQEFRGMAVANPCFREADLNASLRIDGKNTSITVADSKQLLDALSLTALEKGYRSVIIYLPEKMNAEAANKLLKLIEEPPLLTQFLLISHRPDKILPTISSRCQRIRVHAGDNYRASADFESPELFFELADALVSKNLLSCLETGEKLAALPSRESMKAFCMFAADKIRHIFLIQQGLGKLVGNPGQTGSPDDQESVYRKSLEHYAGILPASFPRKALSVLDRTMLLVDRNVNLKLVVADMADKLYKLL